MATFPAARFHLERKPGCVKRLLPLSPIPSAVVSQGGECASPDEASGVSIHTHCKMLSGFVNGHPNGSRIVPARKGGTPGPASGASDDFDGALDESVHRQVGHPRHDVVTAVDGNHDLLRVALTDGEGHFR